MRIYGALLSALVMTACASLDQVPPPASEQSSALGMFVEVRVSGLATYRADVVYFIKRCAADALCDDRLVASNYAKDGRVYLLNAEPGEYLAVLAAFTSGMPGDNSLYFAYFPAALSNSSATTVHTGGLAYAGRYRVFASLGLCPDNAEPGQLKYAQMIEPDSPKCGFWQPLAHKLGKADLIFIGGKAYSVGKQTFHYRATSYEVTRDGNEAAAFLARAQADLAGAGWLIAR